MFYLSLFEFFCKKQFSSKFQILVCLTEAKNNEFEFNLKLLQTFIGPQFVREGWEGVKNNGTIIRWLYDLTTKKRHFFAFPPLSIIIAEAYSNAVGCSGYYWYVIED